MHRPRMHGREEDSDRIRRRVTKMLKAGRVTPEEADRVLAAPDSAELERAVADIRVRHVRARLDDEISGGRMTEQEADLFIQRLLNGEETRLPSRSRRRRAT